MAQSESGSTLSWITGTNGGILLRHVVESRSGNGLKQSRVQEWMLDPLTIPYPKMEARYWRKECSGNSLPDRRQDLRAKQASVQDPLHAESQDNVLVPHFCLRKLLIVCLWLTKRKQVSQGLQRGSFVAMAEAEGKGLSTESIRELPPNQIIGAEDFLHAPSLYQIHHLST